MRKTKPPTHRASTNPLPPEERTGTRVQPHKGRVRHRRRRRHTQLKEC